MCTMDRTSIIARSARRSQIYIHERISTNARNAILLSTAPMAKTKKYTLENVALHSWESTAKIADASRSALMENERTL